MPAPTFVYGSGIRRVTAASDLVCGTIVQSADGLAGYVEAQRGIRNGEVGNIRIDGVVEVDKASADNIAAGARMQFNTTTQVASVLASGSATLPNILCGRAVAAAGVGTVRMLIDLNRNLNQA